MMDTLHLGIERVPITPPIGVWQIGYFGREHGSDALFDNLYASAMVLDNGETRLALVCCDLLFLHSETVAIIRHEIHQRTGIPSSQIMLCCSHTHSGPITYVTAQQSTRDRAYVETLVHCIVGAVVAADRQRQPVTLRMGHAQAHIGINRREQLQDGRVILGNNPAGPVDPQVLVARFDSREGYPLAALVNYACHGVVLSGDSYGLSADWPGAMRDTVELETGASCFFIQGACADINPLVSPQRDYAHVQRLGRAVGGAVIQAWAMAEPVEPEAWTLAAAQEHLLLPLWQQSGETQPTMREVVESKLRQSWETFASVLDERFPWAATIQERDGLRHIAAEVQVMRCGPLAITAVPVEPFVEIGLQVKAASALPYTMFAGYSNGCIGYLPVPEAYELGGYEVDTSYIYYHLPAPLAPTSAERVAASCFSLLKQLA